SGGMEEWIRSGREVDAIPSVTGDELVLLATQGQEISFLDVRRQSEYLSEHLIGAENIPLDYINDNLDKIDPEKIYHVYCAGGYRSMVFNSILKARGFINLVDIQGGFNALKKLEKFQISD